MSYLLFYLKIRKMSYLLFYLQIRKTRNKNDEFKKEEKGRMDW